MRIRRNHGGVKTMMDELWRKSLWLKRKNKFEGKKNFSGNDTLGSKV